MNNLFIMKGVTLVFKKRPTEIKTPPYGNAGYYEPNCPMAVQIGQKEVRFIVGKNFAIGLHSIAMQTIQTSGLVASDEFMNIHSTSQEIRVSPVTLETAQPIIVLNVEQLKFHRRLLIKQHSTPHPKKKLQTAWIGIGIQKTEIKLNLETMTEIWQAYREFRKPK